MKKRILSVFLTAAILFGAASLSALGASNKIFTGENSRYKIEGEVYKAYDELYGLTENLGNALDDKDSAKIDQSQSNWKLVCNDSWVDKTEYFKVIFNDESLDSNYVTISPSVSASNFKYKFGAVFNKSSKRMIISPVYTWIEEANKTSTASLVFTTPKAGKVVLYDLYGDAITAMTEGPFWSFGTKDDEYHNKNGVMRADINFYHNTTLLKTAQISETVHSADFPDLGEIEVAAGDTLKIEVLYKMGDISNGYGSKSERNAVSINPAVAYTEVYQDYSAYEYLNKYVSDAENYPDGTALTDFTASAPWSMKYVNPVDNSEYATVITVIRDVKPDWHNTGSYTSDKTDGLGVSDKKSNINAIFHDGKLLINNTYGNGWGWRATALRFTAPKDGKICIKNDGKIKVFSDNPVWTNLANVAIKTKINLNGKTVEGSEQKTEIGTAALDYNNVYLTVKEGDVVDFLAWSEYSYSYTDFAPVISYISYGDENQTTESINALAIGNSLTEEATAYLHTAFSAIGVNDIKIGAYISENALSAYAAEITNDSLSLTGAYTLCDNGVSGAAEQLTLKAAAEKADWDVVILQSSSEDLNNTEFNKTIAAIKKCFPNAKLAYYGTAVPFGDDTHYAKHTDISDKAVLNVIDSVDYYIPAGTAIENCRTSWLGNRLKISGGSIIDGFQSDNGTMSETAKVIAAMTFAEELCDQVADWKYDSFSGVIKDETEFEIVKAAVRRAVMRPYRVTQYAEDTSVTLSGDANCDGKVNICDLVRYGEFTARVNGTEVYKANCDTVKDNRLDEQDLGGIKKLLLAIG